MATCTLLVTLAVPASSASAHPGLPSPVFDPPDLLTEVVYDRTSAEFAADFAEREARGYMVIDLEPEATPEGFDPSTNLWGAVFQKNTDGRAWRSLRGMSLDSFHDEHLRAIHDGMRIVDFEPYSSRYGDPEIRYAAVWVENTEDYDFYLNFDLSRAELEELVPVLRTFGLIPVDIKAYTHSGCDECYATIWVENAEDLEAELVWHLTEAEYVAKYEEMASQGYRPFALQEVRHFGFDPLKRVSAIFLENTGGGWAQYRNMSENSFLARRLELAEQGYKAVAYERRLVSDQTWRYAMIWRKR